MGFCGKVYHFSEESAGRHADRLADTTGVRPNVYQCERCGGWHVGYNRDLAAKMNKRTKQQRHKYHRARKARGYYD